MCDVYIVLYEAYLGPKAADLRVYPVVRCEGVGEETGATHDHSQVKKHGKSLWDQVHKFHLADPRRGVPSFDIEFFTKCTLRDDEMLASTMLDRETMRGFVFGPCKVHDVKAKIQSSEELSHFNLISQFNKKQHDYYMKYRVLVMAAGKTPCLQHLKALKAPLSIVKETDGESNGEMPHERVTAVVAELNRTPVFRLIRQFIFAVVSLAAAISGINTFYHLFFLGEGSQFDSAQYNWMPTRMIDGDRCEALFDQVDRVKNDDDIVRYSYGYLGAAVAVCTDRNQSVFDSEIGSKYLFDAVADATGGACSLPGYYAGTDNISCDGYSCEGSLSPRVPVPPHVPPPYCQSCGPAPYGVMWVSYACEGSSSAPHNCDVFFCNAIEDYQACEKAHVYVYRRPSIKAVKIIFYLSSTFFIYFRLGLEILGVLGFHNRNGCMMFICCGSTCSVTWKYTEPTEKEIEERESFKHNPNVLYSMSSRGFFGPLSLLYQMVRGCTTRVPPIDPPPLPLDVALYLLEIIPNIIVPLYGVWGCSANSWKLIIIVVLGFIKTLIMTCIFGKSVVDRIIAWRTPEEPDDLHDVLITSGGAGASPPPHGVDSGGADAYSPRSSMASSMKSVDGRGYVSPAAPVQPSPSALDKKTSAATHQEALRLRNRRKLQDDQRRNEQRHLSTKRREEEAGWGQDENSTANENHTNMSNEDLTTPQLEFSASASAPREPTDSTTTMCSVAINSREEANTCGDDAPEEVAGITNNDTPQLGGGRWLGW